MNKAEFEFVLRTHPELAANGFLTARNAEIFASERAKLLSEDGLGQFQRACEFLVHVKEVATINRRLDAYTLKHVAERWAGDYVSEGAFVAAAIASGFIFKRARDGAAYFNIPTAACGLEKRNSGRPAEGGGA